MIEIEVTQGFLDFREGKRELYNQRGRTDRKFLMDLDCELFEYHMIHELEEWEDDPDTWMVDAIVPYASSFERTDVKFIAGYYNIDRHNMVKILQQRHVLDSYTFMEWVSKPRRPLQVGDVCTARFVGRLTPDELLDNVQRSFKEDYGFYVDVRKYINSSVVQPSDC